MVMNPSPDILAALVQDGGRKGGKGCKLQVLKPGKVGLLDSGGVKCSVSFWKGLRWSD